MSLENVPKNKKQLSAWTTIKIGGLARNFYRIGDLSRLAEAVSRFAGNFYLLGGGSNLLIKDEEIIRPVIKLEGDFDYVKINGPIVKVGAATRFAKVLNHCFANSLGGLENLVGIPGTIGGMLTMNASAYKRTISEFLESVEVFDAENNVRCVTKDKIAFGYRESSLRGKIVLNATFHLREDRFVKDKADDFLKDRIAKQDCAHPSFGSVFKNPTGFTAGQLIDSCGLKGTRRNDAQISPKHANFIINLGKAAYNDVDYLISLAHDAVQKKYAIGLEEEVIRWN